MRQLVQNLKNGDTSLQNIPVPQCEAGTLLIRTTCSLVSLGTERMLVEFGRANLLEKAHQQPERVRQVLEKIHTNGLLPTLETVFRKLEQPIPLGYSNVGIVEKVGQGCTGFHFGDRVISNGAHADFVCVPQHLCAKIPDNVSDHEAVFTVPGAIALQGIRNFAPELGECVVVYGLGLIGLLTMQVLRCNGCHAIGIEPDLTKVELARSLGFTVLNSVSDGDVVAGILERTSGIGADGVIITASAAHDNIMHQSCSMTRKRGRIVLIGSVNMKMQRADFYRKELSFRVSCSYGAGRYDDTYEKQGHDYPLQYVRWTEQRNFEAFLQLLANGSLQVKDLITEHVPFENFMAIYGDMRQKGRIASILEYSTKTNDTQIIKISEKSFSGHGKLALIGAGNYASTVIIPALLKAHAPIKYICSAHGLSSTSLAHKAHAEYAISDASIILDDPEVSTVIVCTRHNLHAKFVKEILSKGKNAFVEKPLCLNRKELAEIEDIYQKSNASLTVGFNRRFSPFALKMKQLSGVAPKNIVMTVNAGYIPKDSWIQDPLVGGGRILGEVCHFIDLCSYFADSRVIAVCMNALGVSPTELTDNASILLKYANGTNATIHYFSNGSNLYSKEHIEMYAQNSILILDNWRKLVGYGIPGFHAMSSRMNKGQNEQFAGLVSHAISEGSAMIPFDSLKNTTLASFAALESLRLNAWVSLDS